MYEKIAQLIWNFQLDYFWTNLQPNKSLFSSKVQMESFNWDQTEFVTWHVNASWYQPSNCWTAGEIAAPEQPSWRCWWLKPPWEMGSVLLSLSPKLALCAVVWQRSVFWWLWAFCFASCCTRTEFSCISRFLQKKWWFSNVNKGQSSGVVTRATFPLGCYIFLYYHLFLHPNLKLYFNF